MFLKEYFKKRAKRKVEETNRKAAEQAALEQKERYWELSRQLYKTIMFINERMDNSLPIEYTPYRISDWPKVGRFSLKIDDRLSIDIEILFPKGTKLSIYEATFIIDDVPAKVNLTSCWMPEFRKFGEIVYEELEKRAKEYLEKKNTVVDDYIRWRDNSKHVEQKSDEDIPVEKVLEIGRELQNEDKWHGSQYVTVKLLCDTIERLQSKS